MTSRTQWKRFFASSGTSLSENWQFPCPLSWNVHFGNSLSANTVARRWEAPCGLSDQKVASTASHGILIVRPCGLLVIAGLTNII